MPLRQLLCGPRTASGPGWASCRRRLEEHAARCRPCGVATGVVNQVGPSGTAHGSSKLVKTHTPRRGRPSCRNTPQGGLVGAAPWSRSGTGPLPLQTRRVSYGEVLVISWNLLFRVSLEIVRYRRSTATHRQRLGEKHLHQVRESGLRVGPDSNSARNPSRSGLQFGRQFEFARNPSRPSGGDPDPSSTLEPREQTASQPRAVATVTAC